MAAQENHDGVVKFLLSNGGNQSLATEVSQLIRQKYLEWLLDKQPRDAGFFYIVQLVLYIWGCVIVFHMKYSVLIFLFSSLYCGNK